MSKVNVVSAPTRREYLLALIGALLLLAWNMKNSFEFGRLAFVPSYDDVSYFVDALSRYQRFLNGNLLLLFRDAVADPPHAPISTVQAVLSYMAFGVHDWAPYVSNIWIPFAALLSSLWLTRGIGWVRWVLFVHVLTLPMLGGAIVEFRPDIAAGVLAAAAIIASVYAVTSQEAKLLNALCWWAAGLCGAMLWAKPSAALYYVVLLELGLMFALVGMFAFRRVNLLAGLKRSLFINCVGIGLSLPYFAVAGERVFKYTWSAIVRDKSIWAVNMDWLEHAQFYLVGHGGRFMLGLDVWIMVVAVLLLLFFVRTIEPLQRLRFSALLGVTLVGYLLVAVNSVKTQFLGVGFQSLWFMLSFLVLLELASFRRGRLLAAGFAAVAILSVLSVQPTGYLGLRDSAKAQGVRTTVALIEEELVGISIEQAKQKTVFMTFTGFLNRDVLSYNLLKRGYNSLKINYGFFRPSEEDPREFFGRGIKDADIVIAASEGTSVLDSAMPSNRILPLTLSIVQDDPELELWKRIPSGDGSFYIYVRKHPMQENSTSSAKVGAGGKG